MQSPVFTGPMTFVWTRPASETGIKRGRFFFKKSSPSLTRSPPISIPYEQRAAYENWYHAWRKLFACDAAWYVTEIEKGHNTKANAGASEATLPKKLLGMPKLPYYLSTNVPYFSAALSKKESFYILPDKIFYLHDGKLSAYDADEVDYCADIIHPIMDSSEMEIPADAKVVSKTWLKVNADGSRDKRYKNNRQCSICECGRLRISSPAGLNLCLMLSNSEHIDDFNSIIAK